MVHVLCTSHLFLVSLEFTQGDNVLLVLIYEVATTGYFTYQSFGPPADKQGA